MLMRESTQKKREYVMDVALKLFAEHGYDEVTVDDIIKATNTSKGTFYHYFKGKNEIISEMNNRHRRTIEQWVSISPHVIQSLEGHINRLFLDLADNLGKYPKLMRSLAALTFRNEELMQSHGELMDYLYNSLLKWLPDEQKVALLMNVYQGILFNWSMQEQADLEQMLQENLTRIWTGLRSNEFASSLIVDPTNHAKPKKKVAVIGGGLAGLTAAAYLSEQEHIEGILFERSPQLGGRAFTYEKAGFTLNYGAHAVYGIDRHTISKLEQELGLSFSSKQVDKRKVVYEKNDQITPAPLDFVNLIKTELLNKTQKVRFIGEITAIIAQIHQLKNYETLGDYLEQSKADENVKELWEHLVCSNFFITPEDARRVPGTVISDYYQNLFLSQKPVNYILGSWAVITNQLKQKIELSNRWEISLREGIERIRYEDGQYILTSKKREIACDQIIMAMPVQQVVKLMKDTPWEPFMQPYANNRATEVMVYDLGLETVVAKPFSYVSDMNHKMFISDVSATDQTLVPEGGQMLQGVAYLYDAEFENEDARKSYLDEKLTRMEELFDRHYPGWRDKILVKRVSKKAMVQSVKNVKGNKLLPVQVDNVPFYFCGDGCEGKGELAERAFSSARHVADIVLNDVL